MSETDPSPQPLSKMELAVTIINGLSIYVKSPVFARRLQQMEEGRGTMPSHFLATQKYFFISH